MMLTSAISRIPVDNPVVFAFRIRREVSAEDMKAIASTMNDAFDVHQSVSMLLIFEQFEGLKGGAGFDMETISSQFRSLAKVDRYAVVGAPAAAATGIRVMDKVIPVDARTFERADEEEAWRFVAAHPASAPRA